MKTKLVAVIALIFCAFMAEASKVEGNGNIITKEISVDNYSEIELGGNIEYSGNNFWGNRSNKKFPVFKYTHGRSASLKITIDENLFPLLSIKSNNGRLAIRIQDGTRIKPTQYVIEGSSKTLKYLKTSGPMDFEAQNAFCDFVGACKAAVGDDGADICGEVKAACHEDRRRAHREAS